MELLNNYLIEEALIIIPVLLILGKTIKLIPKIKDWMIPFLLLILGIIFTIGLIGFSVDAFVQGVLVSGAAVYGNQLYKQGRERE